MKKILFFILLLVSLTSAAQTETEIRNHYQDVNARIKESIEHGMEGPLYLNEWTINKNQKSWPAVGTYEETTGLWYDDDPNHISTKERDPKTVLLKVTVNRRASMLVTNEEYLYKNGRLVFYYCIEKEEGHEWQTRIYFNAKGLFKSSVKYDGAELAAKQLATPEYADSKPSIINIQHNGKKYQDLFVKSMTP